MLRYLVCLVLLFTTSVAVDAQTTINYTSSSEDFLNPERGFYRFSVTRSGNYTPLTAGFLNSIQSSNTLPGANHAAASSLVFRYFYLEDFLDGPISQSYLDQVAADFAAVRAAGVKIIPRFAYTDVVDSESCEFNYCAPFGDATKPIVLQHIAQLTQILQDNADVIAVLQMGFIGIYGEGYYTDHFGYASNEGGQGRLLDENWQDRFEVLGALLSALPETRMVQVRYPQTKQRYVYGVNAPTSSPAVDASGAYTNSGLGRIGFHNDCLLASPADFGTYFDYGNSSDFGGFDTTNLKPYFAADSRFVAVGGETCEDNYNPQSNCSSAGGIADAELRRMHYSYLHYGYNFDVNNDWQSGGCMEDIKRNLGYRFELQQGTFPDQIARGGGALFTFTLKNLGYAAPYNPRKVELLLRDINSGEVWLAGLSDDPRFWDPESNDHTVSVRLCIPEDMPVGNYELLLNLPDPEPALYQRAEYSIRLANRVNGADVWEPSSGYNKLGHQVQVTASGPENCFGGTYFQSLFAALPVTYTTFTAEVESKDVVLRWATSQEFNNDYFEVQRSVDGVSYAALARVPASTQAAYTYKDQGLNGPQQYYYRLRQVDLDGSSTLSEVVTAFLGESPELKVYPNPANGMLYLNSTEGELQVVDQFGRRVPFSRDGNAVDVRTLRPGVYHVGLELRGTINWERVVIR